MASGEITWEPIDPAAVIDRVGGDHDGAAILFLGRVRNHNQGRAVSGMEYQGYEAMARSLLSQIVEEAAEAAGSEHVYAVHRLGILEIGDVSVAIAAATAHRAQSFEATRYVIEEIKKRLPVWKREHYLDGEETWLKGHQPTAPEVDL